MLIKDMRAASYDVRYLDTHRTSTEQTCGRTDQNGKKYAQHHIQGQNDKHVRQADDKFIASNVHRPLTHMKHQAM